MTQRQMSMKAMAVCFLVLTVGMTWPMAIAPGAAYSGRQDYYLGLWDLWWVAHALSESGVEIFWTPLLFHPFGTGLAVQPLTLLQTVAAAPLTLTLGPALTYNLLVLFSFWFAGWMTAVWVRALTGSSLGALVAGVAFAFSPFHYTYIGQLNVLPIGVLPLFLQANLALSRRPTVWRALGAGLSLAAVALVSWYFAVAAGLVGIALSLARLVKGKVPRIHWLRLELLSWGCAALLVAPVALQVLTGFSGSRYTETRTRAGLSFVMQDFNGTGTTMGLWTWAGISVLLLAVIGSWRQKRARPLVLLALAACVLAFGESVRVAGAEIPMPYSLLDTLPVIRGLRYPARFFIFAQLALAGLAGMGAARLAARNRLAGNFRTTAFALLLLVLPLAEFWPGILPSTPLPQRVAIPPIEDSGENAGAVFHMPVRFRNYDGELMFQQLGHRRPISGGYLTRPDPQLMSNTRSDPYLGALLGVTPGALPSDLADGLHAHGFAYVCIQKHPALAGFERLPHQALGPFSFSARRFLQQRLFPEYERQKMLRPEVAAQWISALQPLLGAPVSDTPLATVFRVRSTASTSRKR